jgi:hypothetical protein
MADAGSAKQASASAVRSKPYRKGDRSNAEAKQPFRVRIALMFLSIFPCHLLRISGSKFPKKCKILEVPQNRSTQSGAWAGISGVNCPFAISWWEGFSIPSLAWKGSPLGEHTSERVLVGNPACLVFGSVTAILSLGRSVFT